MNVEFTSPAERLPIPIDLLLLLLLLVGCGDLDTSEPDIAPSEVATLIMQTLTADQAENYQALESENVQNFQLRAGEAIEYITFDNTSHLLSVKFEEGDVIGTQQTNGKYLIILDGTVICTFEINPNTVEFNRSSASYINQDQTVQCTYDPFLHQFSVQVKEGRAANFSSIMQVYPQMELAQGPLSQDAQLIRGAGTYVFEDIQSGDRVQYEVVRSSVSPDIDEISIVALQQGEGSAIENMVLALFFRIYRQPGSTLTVQHIVAKADQDSSLARMHVVIGPDGSVYIQPANELEPFTQAPGAALEFRNFFTLPPLLPEDHNGSGMDI